MGEVDEPEGPGKLVAIRSAGICASDFGYIEFGSTFLLGHELAGISEDGTAVAIEAIFGCGGDCEYCREGRYNVCAFGITALGMIERRRHERVVPRAGALAGATPSGLDAADAALVEPASVAWHACRLTQVGPDKRVAVVGGGAIGLLAAAAAKALGAEVSLDARYPHQIAIGERIGATQPSGVYDVVIEAAGSESALHRSAELARPGGTVGVLGVFGPEVAWPQLQFFLKEIRTVPSLGYCRHGKGRDFVDAAAMLAANPDLVDALVTHRFPIEDAAEAFRVASDKSTGAIRVLVQP